MTDKDEYSEREYWRYVESIAEEVFEDCDEENEPIAGSDRLHERIDGCCWIIYYYRAGLVLQYSPHEDEIFEQLGEDALHGVQSVGDFHCRAAYHAMMADVVEYADDNMPDPELTYDVEWSWDFEYWPEASENSEDEESEDDMETVNTLTQARALATLKMSEIEDIQSRRPWTHATYSVCITDSEGEEYALKE